MPPPILYFFKGVKSLQQTRNCIRQKKHNCEQSEVLAMSVCSHGKRTLTTKQVMTKAIACKDSEAGPCVFMPAFLLVFLHFCPCPFGKQANPMLTTGTWWTELVVLR